MDSEERDRQPDRVPLGVEPFESEHDEVGEENDRAENTKPLGVLQLAVLVFYMVSGGPFGLEDAVRSAGPLYTLLGFAIMPFVWSLPEAMITAELGSTYPEASGGVVWVEEAFGPFAGWMSGALNWVSGATDNAIYPVLFLDYLLQMISLDDVLGESWVLTFAFLGITSSCLAYVNYRGLPLVGDMSLTICLISLSPFIIFCFAAAPKVVPARWLVMPSEVGWDAMDDDGGGGFLPYAAFGGVLWRPFINNLFWNLNSFDSAASLSGEVRDPSRSFPRAMFLSVGMVAVCYLLPLMIAIGSTDAKQEDWTEGFLARIAWDVVGPWLGGWVVFSAGISNLALFQAKMSSDAFALLGMAERGYLPKLFSHRSQHKTPTVGIIAGLVVILLLSNLENLPSLIEMLNFCYCGALLLEYAAFIKLRISKPDMHRPYKIPIGTVACCICLVPNFAAIMLVMSLASYRTQLYGIGSVVFAALLYTFRWKQGTGISYTSITR